MRFSYLAVLKISHHIKNVVKTTKCIYHKNMEKKALLETPLFAGIKEENFLKLLDFLNATELKRGKGETVFHSGSMITQIGIVLEGRIQIESTDFWGNKTILDSLGEGKVFAETYALTKVPLMVDVVAAHFPYKFKNNPGPPFVLSLIAGSAWYT